MDNGKSFAKPIIDEAPLKSFQAKQQWYQQRQAQIGFAHLIGKPDRLTSVVIPCGLAAVGAAFLGRAFYSLYTGANKGDQ
mmetsp:Transcript_3221/g.9344  ORF Transcript_3221/g.9344 Transcript_3221/m.9344 type:complete len:80 (+) Transcript_3221:117-356(+)